MDRWKARRDIDPFSGITNHISECMDAVLKRLQQWKEAPLDAMFLSLNYLLNHQFWEIQRCRAGDENYSLKPHKNVAIALDELITPPKMINPDDIVKFVTTQNESTDTEAS